MEEYEKEQQINAQYVEEFAMLTSEKVRTGVLITDVFFLCAIFDKFKVTGHYPCDDHGSNVLNTTATTANKTKEENFSIQIKNLWKKCQTLCLKIFLSFPLFGIVTIN